MFKDCPENSCRRCNNKGYITAFYPRQIPKRNTCKTCDKPDHTHYNCPENLCRGCTKLGHIEIDCPLRPMKQKNLNLACGCDKQAIEERRSSYYSQR